MTSVNLWNYIIPVSEIYLNIINCIVLVLIIFKNITKIIFNNVK